MKFKFVYFSLFVSIFLIVFSTSSFAQSVGISPSRIDLGEVERGTSKIGRFYIVTPNDVDLLVRLESVDEDTSFFGNSNYQYLLQNYSEQKSNLIRVAESNNRFHVSK